MFLDDVSVNYLAVLAAAIVFYIIGAIWYMGIFPSHCSTVSDSCCVPLKEERIDEMKKSNCCCIGSYIGEFIISLVIAYVLALFIRISEADRIVEGMTVAFWAWLGFIATTHFSAVLWKRKTLRDFFVHSGFLLVGILAMGAVIMYFEV